jgi:hypothetical protein
MKIAVCYKGIFNFNYLKQKGTDEHYLSELRRTMENHRDFLYSGLDKPGNTVETFFATYSQGKHDRLEEEVRSFLKPREYLKASSDRMSLSTWEAQLLHYRDLIQMLKEAEQQSGKQYDLMVFLRMDIRFLRTFESLGVDLESFNIVIEHLSGNCDDNFWIVPRNHLEVFARAIEELYLGKRITHEMNRAVGHQYGKVHYLEENDRTSHGHKVFEFVRCGNT